MVNRGEIWWVEHPDSGRRPACVLTRQAAIPVLNAVLVAPATRTIRDDGMPEDCALSFDNLTIVPKPLLTGRITTIPDSRLPELCSALRAATGC